MTEMQIILVGMVTLIMATIRIRKIKPKKGAKRTIKRVKIIKR